MTNLATSPVVVTANVKGSIEEIEDKGLIEARKSLPKQRTYRAKVKDSTVTEQRFYATEQGDEIPCAVNTGRRISLDRIQKSVDKARSVSK